ncbi:MAG: translation initiation factor IF-6 [Thermoplasmata archaeon]|nr:translation initiation factor IF-6 [Thermoplasmata archaeon]
MLIRLDVNGNPNIGSLTVASNEVAFVGFAFSEEHARRLSEALGVEVIRAKIGGMSILGSICVARRGRAMVSNVAEDDELSLLREHLDVQVLDDRLNAVGNNVLLGDRAALINPNYSKETAKAIADILDVEVFQGTIGGLSIVGSAAVVNAHGLLCHPKSDAQEVATLREIFGVEVQYGTANFGSPLLGSAIVANDEGAATGTLTTGVELNRIETTLGLIK